MKTGLEIAVKWTETKECLAVGGLPEAGRGKKNPPGAAPEEHSPMDTLPSDFWAPEL